MLNFYKSWFFALDFPRGVAQFYRTFKGKKIFLSRINIEVSKPSSSDFFLE